MKILVVDDEPLAAARMVRLLERLGEEEVTTADSPTTALELFRQDPFPLVFLDIRMPGGSGLELAGKLSALAPGTFIAFQTAYREHALEAFDNGGMGYLVKPVEPEKLAALVEKARLFLGREKTPPLFSGKSGDEKVVCRPEQILYAQADLNETILRTAEASVYVAMPISRVEEALEGYGFLRVHRSYLVNLSKITGYDTVEQSRVRLRLEGIGETVTSSKEGGKVFRGVFSG